MPTQPSDTVLLGYGLIAGGARVVLPPVFDLPFVRAVRGAMFDRLSRAAGVTLSADARRILVDLEEPMTTRGFAEQSVRWAAGRLLPGAVVVDVARNVMRTYGAGSLFARYLEVHRIEPRDPVMDGIEAGRVQRAMRGSLQMASLDHLRAMGHVLTATFQSVSRVKETSLAQRYGDAILAAMADVPAAWVTVLDKDFARDLQLHSGS
jgi:hypothetical protein